MSEFKARMCDNPECSAILPKEETARVKVEIEGAVLSEPIGVAKEMCRRCTAEYVDELTTGNGWSPVKRRGKGASTTAQSQQIMPIPEEALATKPGD